MHPDYRTLEVISNVLEKELPGFPYGKCQETSRVIYDITGMQMIPGFYSFFEVDGMKPEAHWLNYDREANLYVDLTQHQFASRARIVIPKIVIARPSDMMEFSAHPETEYPVPQPQQRLVEIVLRALSKPLA